MDACALQDAIERLYATGLPRGDFTGWRAIDEFYTVATKQWTVITGIPGMGKSEWLDALLVNLASKGDWTFALYSPENFPQELHASKLLEKRTGLPFGRGPNTRMTVKEMREASAWVHEHFMWLTPSNNDYRSLLEAAMRFRSANAKFGVVLDPWNVLEHGDLGKLSETMYVSKALTEVTNWVREHDIHVWIVAHPSKIFKDKNGDRPVPTPYDIAGSANWFNKPDNIITVHRDKENKSQDVDIHIQKVRFKHVGKIGLATLQYDRTTGKYYEPNPYRVVGAGNDRQD